MATRDTKGEATLHLDVLVMRKGPAHWVAHCLQLDLVAEGPTARVAFDDLLNCIDVQVRTCIETDNLDNLYFPAPREAWNKLAEIKKAREESWQYKRVPRPIPARMDPYDSMEVDQFCYA